MQYRTLNPATGEVVKEFPSTTDAELDRALELAQGGFALWSRKPFADRAKVLNHTAEILEQRAEELARMMALEMGKPLAEGIAEAKKCAWVCRFYAEKGEHFMKAEPGTSDGSDAYVVYEPIGPVLAIMPWNFPFWQFYRFAAPALAAGNVALLKHSPNTPQCGQACEDMALEAGADEGVVQNLRLSNEQASRAIRDSRVRGVTLTGSTRAGRQVGQVAGEELKPIVLELGGSDPFIVLDDADVEAAAKVGAASRCLNSGQSCIAAKRFIVQRGVADAFLAAFQKQVAARIVGDPANPETTVGPLARLDLRDQLADQVAKSLAMGAEAKLGGKKPDGPGFFYPPTILTNIPPDSPAAKEEMFGPVASVFVVDSEQDAVKLANSSEYGLGASLWTQNKDRAKRLIPQIEAGAVFVNGMVKSDPRLPFGGIKASGVGRELGREGLLEFCNHKTVWIA